MVQCLACGGVYEPIGADGVQYFHRCPPLSRPELAAAVAAGRIALPKGETVDDAVLRRPYERARLRDENLPSTDAADAGQLRAAGAGVETIVETTPPAPPVDLTGVDVTTIGSTAIGPTTTAG